MPSPGLRVDNKREVMVRTVMKWAIVDANLQVLGKDLLWALTVCTNIMSCDHLTQ